MTPEHFFQENPKVAIAFSGGVDSSYLLYAALHYGAETRAYYVQSAFQPQFELEDAKRLVNQLHAQMTVLPVDILANDAVTVNAPDRCYACKKEIFHAIMEAAHADGYTVLLDGTNASDDVNDRPGMRALRELHVRSPLRECGLTKDEIRRLSKEAGLFTWDKPAYACLATRIPTAEPITAQKLATTERAENYLFSLGFRNFRVRMMGTTAKIQLPEAQLERLLQYREQILTELKQSYSAVLLDMEVRK